jgi:hypothetical protein
MYHPRPVAPPGRIALAQIDPTVGDLAGNAARIRSATERARAAGATLVVFPELALSGYPPRDLLDLPEFLDRCARTLDDGPRVLAQADKHHFVQARFDLAHETRVGFHSAANQHVVGFVSVLVEMHRDVVPRRVGHDHGLHRGADLGPHVVRRNAVAFQNRPLAFRRASAVRTHRGHDERLRSQPAKMGHGRLDDLGDVGDPSTARRDRHGLSRLDFWPKIQSGELFSHLGFNVHHARSIKRLPQTKHARKSHHPTSGKKPRCTRTFSVL